MMKDAIEKALEILFKSEKTKTLVQDLVHITSFSDLLRTPGLVVELAKRIVFAVEIIYKEYKLIEPDERLDVAAQLLDDFIQFKGWARWFEPFDKAVFKVILSIAVYFINSKFGHNWNTLIGLPGNSFSNVSEAYKLL